MKNNIKKTTEEFYSRGKIGTMETNMITVKLSM